MSDLLHLLGKETAPPGVSRALHQAQLEHQRLPKEAEPTSKTLGAVLPHSLDPIRGQGLNMGGPAS